MNVSSQEKQTKEALTRKQQKGKKKGGQEEESQEAPELLKRPKEYTVKFTFPNPPPLSPPILGLHSKNICTLLHQLRAVFSGLSSPGDKCLTQRYTQR